MDVMAQHADNQGKPSKLPFIIGGAVVVVAAIAALAAFVFGSQPAPQPESADEAIVEQPGPEPQPATGVKHIVVIGEDAWPGGSGSRSDLLMLMRVDFDNNVVHEVSIPRDTAYTWTDGSTIKANQAYEYGGGAEAACQAVSTITGVEVDDYVVVGFDGLQSIVDHFGGIDVDLPVSLDYHFYTNDYPDEHFEAGEQTLDPWRAMALSRARTGYDAHGLSQEMMRQIVDRQMLTTLIGYVFNSDDPTGTIQALASFAKTSLSADELKSWSDGLFDSADLTVYGTTGPVDGSVDATTKLWLVPYDAEAWSALMGVVEAGGDPATSGITFTSTKTIDSAPINSTTVFTR